VWCNFVKHSLAPKKCFMAVLQQLEKWSITHPRLFVLLRVALGTTLIFKGIVFIGDMMSFRAFLAGSSFSSMPDWVLLFITWAHLLCGFLITIGLFTRIAVLAQIPILIGAIFINAPRGFFTPGSELIISILTLLLLVFFVLEGPGPLSVDHYFKKYLL
jgi:putative oxidoreductase